MTDSEDFVQVHVDFNDLDGDGRFFVLREDANGALDIGLDVNLCDAEGNGARGKVVELLPERGAIVAMIAGSWHRPVTTEPVADGNVVEQVCALLAPSLKVGRPLEAWYQFTSTPFGALGLAASAPVGVFGLTASSSASPRSEGAVLSSL